MNEHPAFPADFLNQSGINRQHVFNLDALPTAVVATLGNTDGYRQLILLGHGGRHLWECVKASGIGGEHPIDDYCRQMVSRWFAGYLPGRRYRMLYPGEQPVGLQQLGTLAGWHQPSPFMVGIDTEWGSWFAYRAALLALPNVHEATPTERGALVFTTARDDVPVVVAACVTAGSPVYGVDPRDPNLEDVYFAALANGEAPEAPPC